MFKIQDAELRASMRALDEFEAAKRAAAIEAAAADGGGFGDGDRPGTYLSMVDRRFSTLQYMIGRCFSCSRIIYDVKHASR